MERVRLKRRKDPRRSCRQPPSVEGAGPGDAPDWAGEDLPTVERRSHRGRLILVLHGELDHFTAGGVRAAIADAVADGHEDLVLDLSALSFMDCGAVALLRGLRDPALGARCTMVDGAGPAARVLRLVGGPPPLPPADVPPAVAAPTVSVSRRHPPSDP